MSEDEAPAPAPAESDDTEHGRHEFRRRAAPHVRALSLLALMLVALLGLAIGAQVRSADSGDALDSARPADLLAVLDNLNRREASLRSEIASLQQTLASLQQTGSPAAIDEARGRLDALSIQVGSVAANGPGVHLRITDDQHRLEPAVLLDLLQELRAAGAEAIQITGRDAAPLRVGVDTWMSGSAGRITVDGTELSAPYDVDAIGDGPTLAAALNIPGGVVDMVTRSGGNLDIRQTHVAVTALRDPKPRQYAQPGN